MILMGAIIHIYTYIYWLNTICIYYSSYTIYRRHMKLNIIVLMNRHIFFFFLSLYVHSFASLRSSHSFTYSFLSARLHSFSSLSLVSLISLANNLFSYKYIFYWYITSFGITTNFYKI